MLHIPLLSRSPSATGQWWKTAWDVLLCLLSPDCVTIDNSSLNLPSKIPSMKSTSELFSISKASNLFFMRHKEAEYIVHNYQISFWNNAGLFTNIWTNYGNILHVYILKNNVYIPLNWSFWWYRFEVYIDLHLVQFQWLLHYLFCKRKTIY